MRPTRFPALASLPLGVTLACSPGKAPPALEPLVEYLSSPVTEGLDLPFSDAVRIGDLVILSGMIGNRPGTLDLAPGGLEAEARQALENVRTTLEAAGGTLADIVKCSVMLDEIGEWSAFNLVYAEFFGDHRPARSAFGADGLALGAAVEIECTAVVRRAEPNRPG